MTDEENASDRRTEQRRPAGGRISWRRADDGETHRAWLSDVSARSLSFVAGAGTPPRPGERLEVRDTGGARRCCCVTRVAPYDARLTLVAARTER